MSDPQVLMFAPIRRTTRLLLSFLRRFLTTDYAQNTDKSNAHFRISSVLSVQSVVQFFPCPIPAIFRQKTVIWPNTIGHCGTFWDIKMGKISQSLCDTASISPFFHNVVVPPTPGGGTFSDIFGHPHILHGRRGIFNSTKKENEPRINADKRRWKCPSSFPTPVLNRLSAVSRSFVNDPG